jgi:sRNA-binding protein
MRRLRGRWRPFRAVFSCAVFMALLIGIAAGQTGKDAASQAGATNATAAQKPAVQSVKPAEGAVQKDSKVAPMSAEEQQQAQLVADTNKLYQLAQELKVEVAKSNKDTLSISVIKKATEVEKLAKSLKERMRKQ